MLQPVSCERLLRRIRGVSITAPATPEASALLAEEEEEEEEEEEDARRERATVTGQKRLAVRHARAARCMT